MIHELRQPRGKATLTTVSGQQAPRWEEDDLLSHLQSFAIIINTLHLPKRPLLPGYTSSKTSLTRKSSPLLHSVLNSREVFFPPNYQNSSAFISFLV